MDDDVHEWLKGYTWSVVERVPGQGRCYARRESLGQTVYLHRLVAGVPGFFWVGFLNGDGLDCVRANLYVVDLNDRDLSCQVKVGGRSEYRGVTWDQAVGLWRAEIGGLLIGHYVAVVDAARAYNTKALELYPTREEVELNRLPFLSDSLAYSMPQRGEGKPNRDKKQRGYYETEKGRYVVDTKVDGKRRVRRVRMVDGEATSEEHAAELAEATYREADAAERIAR